MPIKRSTYQSEKTLTEFYNEKEWEGSLKGISQKMLELIDFIDKNFIETSLIASTSHQRLCIQSKDDETMEWIVIISYSIIGEYHFEYRVSKDKSPWNNAWMKGIANNFSDAIIYLIKSMDESEIWKGNRELIKLKKEYNIVP